MAGTHITELRLPRLGETMERGRVTRWMIAPGQRYARGEILLEVETDKTIVEVPALQAGRLVEILVAQDDSVTIDAAIARVEVAGAPPTPSAPAQQIVRADGLVRGDSLERGDRPVSESEPLPARKSFVSPRARRLAREHGIDASALQGSGRHGRVQAEDVRQVVADGIGQASAAADGAGDGDAARAVARAVADISLIDGFLDLRPGRVFHRRWVPVNADRARPLMVLVHGLFGDADGWAETGLALARAGLEAIAFDLPAHGQSRISDSTMHGQTSALHALLQHLERPVVLIGHSFGGAVAAEVAASLVAGLASHTGGSLAAGSGDQVQAMVLIAPVGLGRRIDQDFIDSLTVAASQPVLKRELARLTVKPMLPGSEYLEQLEARLLDQADALRSLCAQVSVAGVQRLDIRASLNAVRCPVSVIWGREDVILHWQDALNAPVGSALYLLPRIGHMPMWEASTVVQSIVLRTVRAARGDVP